MLMQTFPSQFWVGGKRLGRKRRGGETSVIPNIYLLVKMYPHLIPHISIHQGVQMLFLLHYLYF